MAIQWCEQIRDKEIVICSDSVSALTSIETGTSEGHQDLLHEILFTNSRLTRDGRNITFMWIPEHGSILGNERADKLAKEAVKKEAVESNIKL